MMGEKGRNFHESFLFRQGFLVAVLIGFDSSYAAADVRQEGNIEIVVCVAVRASQVSGSSPFSSLDRHGGSH